MLNKKQKEENKQLRKQHWKEFWEAEHWDELAINILMLIVMGIVTFVLIRII